jgi:hypothetical protein
MNLHPAVDDPHGVGGTLGMDFLLGRLTSLDFARQQICWHSSEVERATAWPEIRFMPAQVISGRLVLSWGAADGNTLRCFLDTGTGAVAFVLKQEAWRRLTARTGDEQDNPHVRLPALHGYRTLIGSSLATTLSFGDLEAGPSTKAFFVENGEATPSVWPSNVDGLCGNALFSGRIVIDARGDAVAFGVGSPADGTMVP